jgi:hypothetical protein
MKKSTLSFGLSLLFANLLLSACDSDEPSDTAQGGEGEACYSNGTCNQGLSCLSNRCVNQGGDGDSGGTTGDGDSGGMTGDGDSGGASTNTGGGTADSGGNSGDGGSGGGPSAGGAIGNIGGAPSAGGMGGEGNNSGPWELFDGDGTWVDGMDNNLGIQGSFFVLEDSMDEGVPVPADNLDHTDLEPNEFTDASAAACVSGIIGAVTDIDGGTCDPMDLGGTACEWSAVWGGGIGLNLNETGGEDSTKSPWNALAAGVTGFSFQTSGSLDGAVLRFKAKMEGSDEDFCTQVSIGSSSIDLADLRHNCYVGGVATQSLDVTKIVQLEWQLVSDANVNFYISDFCIGGLSAY